MMSSSSGGVDPDGGDGGGDSNSNPAEELPACDGVGVCDDHYVDVCDQGDDTCPTTQASSIDEPSWDCEGEPPSNVYAYAKFPAPTSVKGANLAPNACVVFFEGAQDLFYAKWFNFGPAEDKPECRRFQGCVCPREVADASFDRRLYAFTWDGDPACEDITLADYGGTLTFDPDDTDGLTQPVSNECRKYLYALHGAGVTGSIPESTTFDLPFSFVTAGLPELKKRLADFPKIEVACVKVLGIPLIKDRPSFTMSYAQLWASDVQVNPGFEKKK